jgi:hypothetical protein
VKIENDAKFWKLKLYSTWPTGDNLSPLLSPVRCVDEHELRVHDAVGASPVIAFGSVVEFKRPVSTTAKLHHSQ